MDAKQFLGGIIRDVCELPDRSSPEDQPEMMLVTPDELRAIIIHHLEVAGLENVVDQVLSEPPLLTAAKNLLSYCESTNAPIQSTIEAARAAIAAASA